MDERVALEEDERGLWDKSEITGGLPMAYNANRVRHRLAWIFRWQELSDACARLGYVKSGTKSELAGRISSEGSRFGNVGDLLDAAFTAPVLKSGCAKCNIPVERKKIDNICSLVQVVDDQRPWSIVRSDLVSDPDENEYDEELVQRRLEYFFYKKDLIDACSRIGLGHQGTKSRLAQRLSIYGKDLRDVAELLELAFLSSVLREACATNDLPTGRYKSDQVDTLAQIIEDPRPWSRVREEFIGQSTKIICEEEEEVESESEYDESETSDEDGAIDDSGPEIIDSCEVGDRFRWDIDPKNLELASPGILTHQGQALGRLEDWWDDTDTSRRNGVVVLPTGSGKTRLAVTFALRKVVHDGGRVLWITPRTELVQGALQTFIVCGGEALRSLRLSRFERRGLRDFVPGDVVVASLSTIAYRRNKSFVNIEALLDSWNVKGPCLVVFDECHHMGAKIWTRAVRELVERLDAGEETTRLLGLSATPTRTQVEQLPAFWRDLGEVIYEQGIGDLIERRVLAKPDFRFVDVDGVELRANAKDREFFEQFKDISPGLVDAIVSNEKFNQAVAAKYLEAPDHWGQVLVFTARKSQAERLAKLFRQHDVMCRVLVSGSDLDDVKRQEILEGFTNREFPILINVAICTEGVDIPKLDSVFIARPTLSRVLTQQMIGRAMRGPAVGGTERCMVVVFHARVVSLIGEVLHSSYTSEADFHRALDISEPEGDSSEPDGEPVEDDDGRPTFPSGFPLEAEFDMGVVERLQKLERDLKEVDFNLSGSLETLPNDMLGWYDAELRGELSIVYTFAQDEEALTNEVERLVAMSVDGLTTDEESWRLADDSSKRLSNCRWILPEGWMQFARALLLTGGSYTFHSLTNVTVEETERLRSVVSQRTALETQTMEMLSVIPQAAGHERPSTKRFVRLFS